MPEKYKRPRTEAQRNGEARYKAKAVKNITLSLNRNTDADILAKLESVDGVQAYIRSCIRADLGREMNPDGTLTVTLHLDPTKDETVYYTLKSETDPVEYIKDMIICRVVH